METPLTLWLTEDQIAAVRREARAYQITDEVVLWRWIRPAMTAALKQWDQDRWDRRRKALETDTTLAATVDAKAAP